LQGQVNIIAEERNYKKVLNNVKRIRRKRQKAEEDDPLGLDGSSKALGHVHADGEEC
jgi:hypothetical protein